MSQSENLKAERESSSGFAQHDSAYTAEWQPIEIAPKCIPILLWWSCCKYPAVGKWEDDGKREGWRCDGDECVPKNQQHCTHWMKLPKPPPTCSPGEKDMSNETDPGQNCEDRPVESSALSVGGLVLRLATRGLVPAEHTLAVWQFADGTGWGAAVTTAYRKLNAEASGDSLQAALEALMRMLNCGADPAEKP